MIAPLQGILSSLHVWLIDTLAILLDLFPSRTGVFGPLSRAIARELRAYLGEAERDAKLALLGLALSRLRPILDKPAPRHPLPGHALRRLPKRGFRTLFHGVFNARPTNIRLRIDRFRDMLEHPERWIARLIKRLERGFGVDHNFLAAPPRARAVQRVACAPAPADSS